LRFRTIQQQGRRCHAYDLFSCFPDRFAAILEDPTGAGVQFLVSREGKRYALRTGGQAEEEGFFLRWKQQLATRGRYDSPCIANLFYASYEAAGLIEKLPEPASNPPLALMWTLYPEWSLCFEGDRIHLAAADEEGLDALQHMIELCARQDVGSDEQWGGGIDPAGIRVSDADGYMQQVRQVKELIAAGDIFQANIARFWSVPLPASELPWLYRKLRIVNPAPFSCYVRVEGEGEALHLLSASPERLFRIGPDGLVETRPIAGTRRRGEGESDAALRDEMLLSDKERAEHIMLVDLERNDLGRVSIPGTIEVNERMVVEGYATVQHIVSNVRGRLRNGLGVIDVFRAMFPGGTITGCPKVRCMQIIRELEGRARGPYTGGVGYSAWNGSADMNILIRSFWHHNGMLNWAAGAGIVADSDPEFELQETGHKADGLMRALFAAAIP
jgi:anthranilate synthase component I